MFEVLFFVGFVSVLLFTGVSFAGVILALSMGLTLLLIAGMFLLLLKLLLGFCSRCCWYGWRDVMDLCSFAIARQQKDI